MKNIEVNLLKSSFFIRRSCSKPAIFAFPILERSRKQKRYRRDTMGTVKRSILSRSRASAAESSSTTGLSWLWRVRKNEKDFQMEFLLMCWDIASPCGFMCRFNITFSMINSRSLFIRRSFGRLGESDHIFGSNSHCWWLESYQAFHLNSNKESDRLSFECRRLYRRIAPRLFRFTWRFYIFFIDTGEVNWKK